ncbi:MAG: molybdopterin-dependent oxidoreductase [Chloroflexi bacterium]|nr:molybdopterin-dependent oxidoreductase [Chloroflexota bacterium]
MLVSFVLNGEKRKLEVEPRRSLLRVLRDDLRLTGTKEGCDGGECGSCTVLMDGKATMSCRLPIARVEGKEIQTIENLGTPEGLHPLQEAFVELGAIQCGFCTPGMIMQAQAILQATPNPTREDVVRRLSRNLCRCTGYVRIIDAILYAAHLMRGGERRPKAEEGKIIGASVERVDFRDKVTGRFVFAGDQFIDSMLHLKLLRSPHNHAIIRSIDTGEAERLPGVVAVLTAKDIPGSSTIQGGRPQARIFATDRARFMGEGIVAVVAETAEIGTEALSRIKVDYEPLPAVFDQVEALKPDAPALHPNGNLDHVLRVIKGDVEQGFAHADVIVENTYITPFREHAYLEPEAGIAYRDGDGRIVVQSAIAHPYRGQGAVAAALGIELDKVRIKAVPVGGNFGGKGGDFYLPCLLALAVHKTGRPVKMVFSREESLLGSSKGFPFHMTYRMGATKEGKLVALQADIIGNNGSSPGGYNPGAVPTFAAAHATGPYFVPNVRVEVKVVCTNSPKAASFRGFEAPQLGFAVESQMQLLAEKLGMDPVEFRHRNALEVGLTTGTGHLLDESVGVKQILDTIRPHFAAAMQAKASPKDGAVKRGVGLGCVWHGYGGQTLEPVGGAVELLEDGRVRVYTGATDLGQGSLTTIAQIAAEEMGVPFAAIDLLFADTLLVPYPASTGGQKTTYMCGMAVKQAAAKLKEVLLKVGAEVLEEKLENVRLEKGSLFSIADPSQRLSLERLAALGRGKGIPLKHEGGYAWRLYKPIDQYTGQGILCTFFGYAVQMAEVEVNTRTGHVQVLRIVHVGDVGKVLHPQNLASQVEGGAVMGLGFALMENFVPGQSRGFDDYRIPTTRDAPPEIVSLFVEDPVPSGPFGAKGAVEMTGSPTAPAIINAIADAIGVRIRELPATPDRIRRTLA